MSENFALHGMPFTDQDIHELANEFDSEPEVYYKINFQMIIFLISRLFFRNFEWIFKIKAKLYFPYFFKKCVFLLSSNMIHVYMCKWK